MDYTCPQKGKVSMPKEQRTFSKEFKLEAVPLAQSSGGLAPFEGAAKAARDAPLFDSYLPMNVLHVALPPNRARFPQMARFMTERAYELLQACTPGGVCTFPSGIAVWALTPLDMPGPLAPPCAARRSADTVSLRRDQRPQAASARLPVPLLPARSGWHTYRAA